MMKSSMEKQRIIDLCEICQRGFNRHYQRAGSRKRFCSKKCAWQALKTKTVTLTCKTCERTFSVINRYKTTPEYCSRECIPRHPCLFCGEPIHGRQTYFSNKLRTFCSRKCSLIVNTSLRAAVKYTVLGFAERIRIHGTLCCENCLLDDIRLLVVHHRDRRHSNNHPSNLATLCHNCHHLEHWPDSNKRRKSIEIATIIGLRLREDPTLLDRISSWATDGHILPKSRAPSYIGHRVRDTLVVVTERRERHGKIGRACLICTLRCDLCGSERDARANNVKTGLVRACPCKDQVIAAQ